MFLKWKREERQPLILLFTSTLPFKGPWLSVMGS